MALSRHHFSQVLISAMIKKALITGGAGFIGSHLARRLLSENYEVTVLDNLFTGTKSNIYDLLDNRRFTFILHDVTQPFWGQFDEIYNLACPASPIHYQRNPVETIKTSFVGMMNVLELALKTKAKVLHTSTSEIYGDPLEHPQRESYWGNVNTIGTRSCYDEGKRAAETLARDYHCEYGVDVRMVRRTAASSPTSSCRRCAANPSPSTATAPRRAPSSMSMTSSRPSAATWRSIPQS